MDLLLRSDKRRQILLFLRDGPKNIGEITGFLGSSCTATLPQIKRLTEKKLIEQEDKNYKLSTIGLIITQKMASLTGTFEIFEDNLDYWGQKDLTGIPSFLRLKLGKLSRSRVIESPLNRTFDLPEEFIDSLKKSAEILHFSSFFQPSFSGFAPDFLKRKTDSTFIFTKNFFERILNLPSGETVDLMRSDNSNLYLYGGTSSVVLLTVTDRFMALLLPNKKGMLDRNLLISFDSEAIEWGKELFMYYRDLSRKVSGDEVNNLVSE